MTTAVLSLGSNLGDRVAHLRTAVAGLEPWLLVVSGVYETPPWSPDGSAAGDPPYLNAVVLVADDDAEPRDWLDRARTLESEAGRARDPDRRFAPRTLDVDVIVVWRDSEPVVSDDPELTLPHPRAHLRAFVLRPWIDIQPYARLPGHGALTDLLNAEPIKNDLPDVRACPGVELESAR